MLFCCVDNIKRQTFSVGLQKVVDFMRVICFASVSELAICMHSQHCGTGEDNQSEPNVTYLIVTIPKLVANFYCLLGNCLSINKSFGCCVEK